MSAKGTCIDERTVPKCLCLWQRSGRSKLVYLSVPVSASFSAPLAGWGVIHQRVDKRDRASFNLETHSKYPEFDLSITRIFSNRISILRFFDLAW